MYDMTKINFNMENELFKKFKKYCVDVGKSMTDVLVEQIKEVVEKNGN